MGLKSRLLDLIGRRAIDHIGRKTRLVGRMHVINDGQIEIGSDCYISSHPIQSHLLVMPGGRISIGDRVHVSYGAGMSSQCLIAIGDNTQIGPFSMILDNDFHKVGDKNAAGGAEPVHIGRGVTIGARVTILRGARIGDGAKIMSGSTVFGVIPSNAVVTGVPAKSLVSIPRK